MAFGISPLMLHEACSCYMASFKWKNACDSHWLVYAENPHQLCFFASSISFTVCHLYHALLHRACLIVRQPVFMSCN